MVKDVISRCLVKDCLKGNCWEWVEGLVIDCFILGRLDFIVHWNSGNPLVK